MFRVFSCLTEEHDWHLVLLAGLVCFLTSLAAILLFRRAGAARGRIRAFWLLAAAAAAGCGIWATHFIAVLAYQPGVSVHYDTKLTILSLVVAVAAVSTSGPLIREAAAPALAETKGSIVNVTSLAGIREVGSSVPYACSKAATNHMTELVAKVLGPDVRVNAVAPGLVDTPRSATWEAARQHYRQVAPMQRGATADEVADAVLYVAGSPYMTGEVLVIDGGYRLVR